MTDTREFQMGIIGAGAMGRAYCECLKRSVKGARLVAVAGGSRAASLARDYSVDTDAVERVLHRPDLGAVIVATPETEHCRLTLTAAAAGKHVLVEKPMAPTVRECDEMIAACALAGVKLMVVKHWRFRGVHTRARELLATGTLGPIRTIVNQTHSALPSSLELVARKPFYLDPQGGGLLMGWAVHNLDWVSELGDAPVKTVTAVTPTRTHPVLGPTHAEVEIGFTNGITAQVRVSIDLPAPPPLSEVFRTRITTERAALDLDGYGAFCVNRGGTWETLWTQPTFDPRNATDPLRLEAYASLVQAFIDSVREDRPPPVSGEDGRRAVALFHRVIEAGRRAT